jgi:uncharacterized protein (TIGR02001 family)
MHKKSLLALVLLAALPFAASAQDEDGEESSGPLTFTASATLTSDYVWRGVSQSQEDPALQGELAFEHESGFYGGVWGSSVDFTPDGTLPEDEDDADLEVDAYIGYAFDISDTLAADVQLVRYMYPGAAEGIDYDYNELIGSLTFNELVTATVGYTNDVFALDDDGFYVALSGSYGLPIWDLSLDGEIGHFTVGSATEIVDDEGEFLGTEDLEYLHYSLGLSMEFGPLSTSLTWSDTSDDARDYYGDTADSRVFLSFTLATDI